MPEGVPVPMRDMLEVVDVVVVVVVVRVINELTDAVVPSANRIPPM
jgi:hypothetical protein